MCLHRRPAMALSAWMSAEAECIPIQLIYAQLRIYMLCSGQAQYPEVVRWGPQERDLRYCIVTRSATTTATTMRMMAHRGNPSSSVPPLLPPDSLMT